MDKSRLLAYLEALDGALKHQATLYAYGSAALILLDEPDRTSMDVDVAASYSVADFGDLRQAAERVGLPIDPEESYQGDHIEWVGPLRLCLPAPSPETEITLWRGARLTVKTVSAAELIASKLIRYDEIDQGDIRYLHAQTRVAFSDVVAAVRRLPPPFRQDPLIVENLRGLEADMTAWGANER